MPPTQPRQPGAMSLHRKFAVLLGLFGLTVMLSVGASMLFSNEVQRALIEPFRSTTDLLQRLARLKRDIGDQTRRLPGPGLGEPGLRLETAPEFTIAGPDRRSLPSNQEFAAQREFYFKQAVLVDNELRELLTSPQFTERIGVSTGRSLKEHIAWARAAADRWFSTMELSRGEAAGEMHFQLHELIERIESRVLAQASDTLVFGDAMMMTRLVVLASAVMSALLLFALGVQLVRRWVNRPITNLRIAAGELARGKFEHRVPVESNDDLGLLSREVNDMAGLIGTMQAEAVERERLAATGEMVRRLAHNIRNPLAGIRGLAELTLKRLGAGAPGGDEQRQIVQAVDRFNSWLKDLLEVSSPLEVHPIPGPVKPWLRGIIESNLPLARMRSVDLRPEFDEAPDSAVFDPRHLEHAVVALVTNAIQASSAGGVVTVSASRAGTDSMWAITVRDQGPGIAPDVREKMFRPYFTTKRDGNGIGLAVAMQVVQRHQGLIEVKTSTDPQDHGTAFVVRLPIGAAGPV